jgi:outer membrane protein insertion porin family
LKTCRAIATVGILAAGMTVVFGCAAGRPPRISQYPSPDETIAGGPRQTASLAAEAAVPASPAAVIRGQQGAYDRPLYQEDAGSPALTRNRMPVTVAQNLPLPPAAGAAPPTAGNAPFWNPPAPPALPGPPVAAPPAPLWTPNGPPAAPPPVAPLAVPPLDPSLTQPPRPAYQPLYTDIDIYGTETQTGRFMFGAGVNSDAGVTGQIVVDERNFDITRVPTSWRDFVDGTAFRGAGQGFRIEAMPGTQVQRYMASFTEPYLFSTPISFNLSGFIYDRYYTDWKEGRIGGRVAFGYRLTPDLSVSAALRAEKVEIANPVVPYGLVPQLDRVLGYSDLFTTRYTLAHDTRDIPFSPTEGHLIELGFEQAFGDYDYPRGDLDLRKYFLVRERPDGSGRHTLGYIFQFGVTGSDTPIFERYYAGGYSTLRGFDFRGASPEMYGVRIGGQFRFLGSAEYTFPITADDMLKAALFVDYGTVEDQIAIHADNFRVSPGFGLRINVPALGPAPLAFDFAFPVHKAPGDETRVFNFFFGVGR